MILGQLIAWLERQNPDTVIQDGFGSPHSDRGFYTDLAFEPERETTVGAMLEQANSAVGASFPGWKGGEYRMDVTSNVLIGRPGQLGKPITAKTIQRWEDDLQEWEA